MHAHAHAHAQHREELKPARGRMEEGIEQGGRGAEFWWGRPVQVQPMGMRWMGWRERQSLC